MTIPLSVLFVDDSVDDVDLIARHLSQCGFLLEWQRVEREDALIAAMEMRDWDIVLCDYVIPGYGGPAALRAVRRVDPWMPLIFISGAVSEGTVVEAMKAGAQDYVMKNNLSRLKPAIERAIRDEMCQRNQYRAATRLAYLAHHDLVTGLANRALYQNRLQQCIESSRRRRHRMAVVFMDLDRFKQINDRWGHEYGDILLRGVGARITKTVRCADVVARIAGDEFALLLTNLERTEDAARAMTALRVAFDEPFLIQDQILHARLSAGVAFYPDHAEEPDKLLRCADVAMYCAKKSGGGYRFYDSSMIYGDLEEQRIDVNARVRERNTVVSATK